MTTELFAKSHKGCVCGKAHNDDLIALQKRADDLALRLEGDDQLLVWKLRSTVEQLAERLAKVRTLAG